MTRLWLIALGVLAATGCAPSVVPSQQPPLPARNVAFTNVTVLPMDTDRVLRGQTVVVQNGVITQVAPSRAVRVSHDATVIDATGKFLLPALADLHVHMAGPREIQLALLDMFVVNGVGTILNMRGAPEHLGLRAELRGGRRPGPTLYTVGPYINEPFVTTADDVERAVVDQKRAGYDFVKLHGDLSREAYARLNAVARREGLKVVGHAPRNLGIDAMFEEKQFAVVHAEEFLYDHTNSSRDFRQVETNIPALAGRMKAGRVWLMPNLTAYKIIGEMARDLTAVLARPEMQYLPAAARTGWGPETNPYTRRFGPERAPGIFERWEVLRKLTKSFGDSGVRLLIGTDAFNTGVVPGWSTHDEMAELVAAGLQPYDALKAATANAADFFAGAGIAHPGNARCAGRVQRGCVADLLLLSADPRLDIANTRRIAGVMLRGRWLGEPELERLRQRLRGS